MNLSFLPADLHLRKSENDFYVITMSGREILSSKSHRLALSKFNSLRKELEERFPAHQLTSEEKAELLKRELKDSLVGHNSLGGRKKKTSAGGTRTFGG